MRSILALIVIASLAGCATSEDATTWHIQGVQCEAFPWGDTAGGETEEPGLEQRLEAHYGFEFSEVKTGSDGKMYAAVCSGASDQHVQASVVGHAEELGADGWALGPIPSS